MDHEEMEKALRLIEQAIYALSDAGEEGLSGDLAVFAEKALARYGQEGGDTTMFDALVA